MMRLAQPNQRHPTLPPDALIAAIGKTLTGIACRDSGNWQLRYATTASVRKTDYRMAGADAASADVIATMIAGDPLDRNGEEAARKTRWR